MSDKETAREKAAIERGLINGRTLEHCTDHFCAIEETKTKIEALPESDIVVQFGEEYDVSGLISDDLKALAADHSRLEAETRRLREALYLLVESPEYFCGASNGDHAQEFCECNKLRAHAKAALAEQESE